MINDSTQGYFKNITKTQRIIQNHCVYFYVPSEEKRHEIYEWLDNRAIHIINIPTPFVYNYIDVNNTWAMRYDAPNLTIWIEDPELLTEFRLTWL